jgi:GMP synthase (glutamine-hydrolysing)
LIGSRLLPRVLLVQVRRSIEALRHERECFERACGELVELDFHNLMMEPEITWAEVRPYDVLLLGGSGECTTTEEYEFSAPLGEVVRRWAGESRPFFGSCWGHQFLASVLGGEVRTDATTSEVGTFAVSLSPAGRQDPLFSTLPGEFQAQMGHHDYVAQLPPSTESLAWSERCPNQAIKVIDKPIYSTQFHSEMGRREIVARLRMYRESYLEGGSMRAVVDALKPSPAVKPLVNRFLELVT